MAHALDRPVWASLNAAHAALWGGNDLARRYARDVNLFASARDNSEAAIDALGDLVRAGEKIYVLQAPPIETPSALRIEHAAMGVQMVATRPISSLEEKFKTLTDADAADMLALATFTNPGPFLRRTHAMGQFIGVRLDGRLAAMAGERMRFPGFTEISGVCTHPDFRGRGLARRLSAAVARRVALRGDTPFLHAWKTNTAAISLYESMGFETRCEVNVSVLSRAET